MSISTYLRHPDRYDRTLGRLLRRLHTRVIRDVIAANLANGSRILDAGTGLPLHITARLTIEPA